jgi:hypothetical protein
MFKTNTMESGEKQRLTLQEAENIIKTEIDHILESGVNAIRLTELFTRIMTRVLSSKEHDLKTLRAFTDHLETQFRETAGRLAEVESKYASQLQPIREKPDFEKFFDAFVESWAFQVPYNGSDKFYNDDKIKESEKMKRHLKKAWDVELSGN